MVARVTAVAKQYVCWIIVGAACFASLEYINMLSFHLQMHMYSHLLVAHLLHVRAGRRLNLVSIGAAASCANQRRWAPRLQICCVSEDAESQ